MQTDKAPIRILFTGGGTAGPVIPLLAIAEVLSGTSKNQNFKFFWIGTKIGLEKKIVEQAGIEFYSIIAGKWRRYFSWQNFFDLFRILVGFGQSLVLLGKRRPNLVISAGGFVGVPVVWAAWLRRIPVLIHQQDIRPGLANRLAAPVANVVTVTFSRSLNDYGTKAVWTGNPIRPEFKKLKITAREARQKLNLNSNRPTILIMGGGTGALALNELTLASLPFLTKFCQVIHITGPGKNNTEIKLDDNISRFYRSFPFLNIDGLIKAYAAADLIISRAGLSSLTELSYLGKPTILIPMPDSHQEDNASLLAKRNAAVVLNQKTLTVKDFVAAIKRLLDDKQERSSLGSNIKRVMKFDANERIKKIIFQLITS
jgi:UDP-N-acetylglucosamine--N-acetylmuramyl-(pentapeptide) pyrophosphoryl-undecaprenol N-acetylglucosamine transferase